MRWNFTVVLLVLAVPFLGACDDSSGLDLDPLLATDTVTVYAPLAANEGLPTGLDITADADFGIGGGRFPELVSDFGGWDFAVRIEDDELVLVPASVLGVTSGAALTPPINGVTFEDLREIPARRTLVDSLGIAMRAGSVYAARSRDVPTFLGNCPMYAKMQPLVVDIDAGILELQVVTNANCADLRLVPVD